MKYTLSYKGIEGSLTAHIGKVDHIEFKDNSDKSFIEKDDDFCEVLVTPVLKNEYDVDITETAFKNSEAEIVYEVFKDGTETAEMSDFSGYTDEDHAAVLTLARGSVTIKAVYYDGTETEDENGIIERTVTAVGKKVITSKERPAYEIKKRIAATISTDTLGKDSRWNDDLSICIGDDKKGGYTHKLQVFYSDNSKDGKTLTTDSGSIGTFRFESTDLDKLYVDNEGTIYAYNAGYEKGTKGSKVQVLVFFKSKDAEDDEEEVIDVIDVNVKPRRVATAATSILSETEGTCYINCTDEFLRLSQVQTSLEIKDQYGDHIEVDKFDIDNIVLETKCPEGVKRPRIDIDKVGDKYFIRIIANEHSLPDGNKDGMEFKYKINFADGSKSYKLKTKSATLGHGTTPAGKTTYEVFFDKGRSADSRDRYETSKYDCHVFRYDMGFGGSDSEGGYIDACLVKKQNGVIVEKLENVEVIRNFPENVAKIDSKAVMNVLTEREKAGKINFSDIKGHYYFTLEKKNSNGYNRFNEYNSTGTDIRIFFLMENFDNNVFEYTENGGIGTYIYNVYQFVEKGTDPVSGDPTYGLVQIGKKDSPLEVYNSMNNVVGGGRTENMFADAPTGYDDETFKEWQSEMVKKCFKFSWFNGEKTFVFEKPEDYEGKDIKIEVRGKGPSDLKSGDIYYVEEVNIYTSVGTPAEAYFLGMTEYPIIYDLSNVGSYYKSTVIINKYVNIK